MMKIRVIGIATVLLCPACADVRTPTQATTPSSPTPAPAPPTPVNGANWVADAVVVSSTGGACGWGTAVGETRSGVLWRITLNDDTVMLDEDMPNWPTDDIPYSGTLTGTRFVATDVEPGAGVCAFRGGDLSGSFSDDRLAFEAVETLRWGSLEHPAIVQRHWIGHHM